MSNGHFSADSPQKSVSSRRIVTVAVICVLVLALAAVGFFLVRPALDPYHCRMADGVSIAGVDVGGMTKGEARKALQAALGQFFGGLLRSGVQRLHLGFQFGDFLA